MGGIELGEKVIKLCEEEKRKINPAYIKYENLDDKIEKICKRCYGCRNVIYSQLAAEKMEKYDLFDYYVCMAKTPISLSDDEKNLVITEPFDIHIKDMIIANGASFIVVLTGNIFRMPGLPKIPEANKM
jgi:formate--tetrahydrofolate ligase